MTMTNCFASQVSYVHKKLVSTKKSLYDSKVLIKKLQEKSFKVAENHSKFDFHMCRKELVSTKKSLYDSKVLIEKLLKDNSKAAKNHSMFFDLLELNISTIKNRKNQLPKILINQVDNAQKAIFKL